jgi:hypothetical protein
MISHSLWFLWHDTVICILSYWVDKEQCWGSVTFWCGSGSPDPYLWLMDPDPDAKKKYIFFLHIFFSQLARRYTLFCLKIKFVVKFCVKMLFCRHYFSPLNTFMRKGKDLDPDPHLWLMDPAWKAQKHADPAYPDLVPDPDPQHWQRAWNRLI